MTWSNGHVPLVTAARLGDVQIINLLLDAGADVNRGLQTITPLMYASYFGHLEAGRILISRGANAKTEGKTPDRVASKVSAIYYAAARGDIEFAKLLWESGVPAMDKNATLLVQAARRNDVPTIQQLLSAGVDVNGLDPLTRERAVDMAAQNGNADASAALAAAGAVVNRPPRELQPLWYVLNGLCRRGWRQPQGTEVFQRYVDTVKVLLNAGARARDGLATAERMQCAPLVDLLKATADQQEHSPK
jgi:ankyrin repeat protein